jgi:AcrR family transcriptional regulator
MKDDRRTNILRASATAIAERGVRGLRVNDVAEVAGVSPGLLYYYFKDRIGLLEAALIHINDRAREYREEDPGQPTTARELLQHALLGEIQDRPDVVENSSAWNELRASAVFEEALREPIARTTAAWIGDIAEAVTDAQQAGEVAADIDPQNAATTMVALIEGLSGRWLCDEIPTSYARDIVVAAMDAVLPKP